MMEIDNNMKSCILDGVAVSLSKNEFEILSFLVENPNKVFTRKELSNIIGKDNSSRAIDTTISRIRKKLGDYSKHLITKNQYGYGWH